jgi:predicted RNA-binding Zn ribbon-like protein
MPHDPSTTTTPAGVRDGFKFRSGRLALDLTATLAGRLRDEPKELLPTVADLGRWLVAAGLAVQDPHPTHEDLEQARELREALYRLAFGRSQGREYAVRDRELLNRWAAQPPPAPQLGADGLTWSHDGARPLLAAVARDGVELLGGPLADRIRKCASASCALLFVDASRTGERRWCSMASCGNKAKVGELRKRRKAGCG